MYSLLSFFFSGAGFVNGFLLHFKKVSVTFKELDSSLLGILMEVIYLIC